MTKKEQIKVKIKPGKIYVLRNPMHQDALVKIGRTKSSSEERSRQVSSSTGVPFPFEVLFEEDVADCELAEKLIHQKLSDYRINKRREFFQLPLKVAVKTVFEICLHINKPLLAEVSRLVIILNTAEAQELKDLIIPFRGGKTMLCLIYENLNGKAELTLGHDWMLDCTADLLVKLRQKRWVDDVFLVTAVPE